MIGAGALAFDRWLPAGRRTTPSEGDAPSRSRTKELAGNGEGRAPIRRFWLLSTIPVLVAAVGLSIASTNHLITSEGRIDRTGVWIVFAMAMLALVYALVVVAENHALIANLEGRVRARTLELIGRERHFDALFERSSDIVMVVRADLTITSFSQGVRNSYGWRREELVGHNLASFGARFAPLVEAIRRPVPTRVEQVHWELHDASGRLRYAESNVANLTGDADVQGYVINTRDITSQRLLEIELRHQAFHDQLTGLSNRALFNDRVEHALDRARRLGTRVAVLLIDLDGFKDVNDNLGHQAGDELLRKVAEQLSAAARTGDTVARLGGDEFVVLMEDLLDTEDAMVTGERMRTNISLATVSALTDRHVTASIGVAVSGPECDTAADLVRNADIAMYSVKADGKDAQRLFEVWMRDQALERFELQTELAGALDRGELFLEYQPYFELATGSLAGFEALLRWQHPVMGLIPPDMFIGIAEESDLIVEIGRWVLYEATRQLGEWSRLLGPGSDFTMAFNVSSRQIRDDALVEHAKLAIASAGVYADRVVLEITESVLLRDPAAVAEMLARLSAEGMSIAIDDFGTGYSSLSYLQDLPVDILKVDKSFVSPIDGTATTGSKLLGPILHLAHSLGLRTIAEGVEEEYQAAFLIASGCDIGQGFLWSGPLSVTEAWELLRRAYPSSSPMASIER
jgi:diguanylate cyclase (GGDEF)-like protein/PAS domain S-box-containing protein